MSYMNKVSCIIPAYNEGLRIKTVLDIVATHPLIYEVIVIDDGSKDNTQEILKSFPAIKNILQPVNRGKSFAISTGIKSATGDFLFFLDADLIGLTSKNITDLIEPVINGFADTSISLRRNTPPLWHLIGLDYISGERVMRKTMVLDVIDEISKLPKFGLEVFLNRLIIKNKYSIKVVVWDNVDSPLKFKKQGWRAGIINEIRMRLDIYKTISLTEKPYQIFKMLKLKVK